MSQQHRQDQHPKPTPIAQALNEPLAKAAPEILEMLSAYGRRLYFPKGIISQSAEAKQKAYRFNATIGIATEGKGPMALPSVAAQLGGIPAADAVTYAPPAGRPGLRKAWREKLLLENPSLADRKFGEPIVTNAITHGLAVAGELFIQPGDVMLMPDKLWGNYKLTFEVHHGATIETFPFYKRKGLGPNNGIDTEGFAMWGGVDDAFAEGAVEADGRRGAGGGRVDRRAAFVAVKSQAGENVVERHVGERQAGGETRGVVHGEKAAGRQQFLQFPALRDRQADAALARGVAGRDGEVRMRPQSARQRRVAGIFQAVMHREPAPGQFIRRCNSEVRRPAVL